MPFPPIDAPFTLYETVVRPEWIDGNGHMSAWEYNAAFAPAMRRFFSMMGLGMDFTEGTGQGIFLLDCRVRYLREVLEGMPIRFETRLLDHSDKVVHYFIEMRAGEERYAAATCEALEIHVDLATRRPAPFPARVQDYLREMLSAHAAIPVPESVGKAMGIRRRG